MHLYVNEANDFTIIARRSVLAFSLLRGGVPALTPEDTSLYSQLSVFGPYWVLHPIGAGVLFSVFRAYNSNQGRRVAVEGMR